MASMRRLLLRLLTAVAGFMRPAAAVCSLALCGAGAHAATYTYANDTYAWETAANTVSWDNTCTSYDDDDDKATVSFSGGFTFPFAGTSYSSVRVMSNGMLQFGADNGLFRDYTPGALPLPSGPARSGCPSGPSYNVIAAYWTDLAPSFGGNVTWQQKGSAPNRYVVISWNAVRHYNNNVRYTFQVILYESGEFKVQYGTNATGGNAAIGVHVSDTDYTPFSYNTNSLASGTAIRWRPAQRVAEYRMDEASWNGSAGEAADSTGNGHGGQRVGSAQTTASGYVCRGMDVPANTNASSSALDTGLDVGNDLGASGSVSFWYELSKSWNSSGDTMLFDATVANDRPFFLMRAGGGALLFGLVDSNAQVRTVQSSDQSFSAKTWVYVTATWHLRTGSNQSRMRLYVNGTQIGSRTFTSTGRLHDSVGTLYIGDNRSGITPNGGSLRSADGVIDEARIYNHELGAAEIAADMAATHGCVASGPHHLEIRHASGTGLTCTPSTLTVVACQDAACSSLYTDGVTGALTASGVSSTFPDGAGFSIASGSSSVDVRLHVTAAGSVSVGMSGVTPSASSAATCNFGAPACTFSAADSGLIFDVPHHVAEVAQTVSVSAVRKADNALACVPAFAGVSKSVAFGCGYANPTSGTLPVRVGGASVACGAGTQAVSLAFDASGVASTTVQYADVGQVNLSASYSGSGADAGLVMSGSDSFIAAPADFAFSAIGTAPFIAGNAFSATVTARNSLGSATPNFGRETAPEGVNLAFTRRQPTGPGASDGSFSGSLGAFSGGAATASNLVWTEVGRGDLSAALASGSYLGSGLGATGSTGTGGAVGPFRPHHFDVAVTPACSSFSYAGQPFAAVITARNAAGATTLNYDGSASTAPNFARNVSLSEAVALGVGGFGSTAAVAPSAFSAGVGNASPAYSFSSKLTAPQSLQVRATDADGVGSSGFAEGSTPLRSGRLRVFNAFGSEKQALQMQLQAEHWSGSAWALNNLDSCTALAASAVALSNHRDGKGAAAGWTTTASTSGALAAGRGTLTLSAPSGGSTGAVDVALNLGSGAADQACLGTHPATTGAGLPWLRSQNGSCSAAWDRDPSARASFGIYSPETRKTIHAREIF